MKHTVTIVHNGVTLEVTGKYTPPDPGVHTYNNGDPGYPPSPAEFYIEEITEDGFDVFNNYRSILDEIEDLCFDSMEEEDPIDDWDRKMNDYETYEED